MEKMKCRVGRPKGRGKRGKHGSPEGEGGGERHAPAKPRLVAVLRSKLRFTRFLQVPTGSHCLSSSPLPFRLICPTFYYSPPHFSSLSRCTVMLAFSFFLPPTLQADLPYSAFPLSLFSAFPKCCLAHIGFLPSPLLRAVSFPLFISLS